MTVASSDAENPFHSAQIQGTARLEEDPDAVLVDELSDKYLNGPYPGFAGPNPLTNGFR